MSEGKGHALAVVGMNFLSGTARQVLYAIKAGSACQLRAEPDNAYDENAVAVYTQGIRVGYIARQQARALRETYCMDGKDIAALICFAKSSPGQGKSGFQLLATRSKVESVPALAAWLEAAEDVVV